jgi:riboflavin synthase
LFTGIIESVGIIDALEVSASGGRITVQAPSVTRALAVSNSIAVNGCCLTVVALGKDWFAADLSAETIQRTSFGTEKGGLKAGSVVNLERPLIAGKEFGGHFVLGHVDGTGRIAHLAAGGTANTNRWLGVSVPKDLARYIVPKGSITIDGISLTVARWSASARIFDVALIPYTYEHTNLRDRKPGEMVNLEGDVLGKYVERYLEARSEGRAATGSSITVSRLLEEGF